MNPVDHRVESLATVDEVVDDDGGRHSGLREPARCLKPRAAWSGACGSERRCCRAPSASP
jgi:hypothetical protein